MTTGSSLGPLFDVKREEGAAEQGMGRAANARVRLLATAQRIAVDIARMSATRTCDADQVQQALMAAGHKSSDLGNAAGSIFRSAQIDGRARWEWTGEYRKSGRKGSHGNLLRVWRLLR